MRFATIGLMVLATACAADVDGGGAIPAGAVPNGKQDATSEVTAVRTIPGFFTEYRVQADGGQARTAVVLEGPLAEPFLAVDGLAGDAATAQIYCDAAEATCTIWDVTVSAEFKGDKYWYARRTTGQLFRFSFDTQAEWVSKEIPNGLFDAVSLMQEEGLGEAETETHIRYRRNFDPSGMFYCGAIAQSHRVKSASGYNIGDVLFHDASCGAYDDIRAFLPRPDRSALSLDVALDDDLPSRSVDTSVTVKGDLADQIRELVSGATAPLAFVSCNAETCSVLDDLQSTKLFGEPRVLSFNGTDASVELANLMLARTDAVQVGDTDEYRWGNFTCRKPSPYGEDFLGACTVSEGP